MQHGGLNDLRALVAVARERSFTKAAAKLGVSQSALSHTVRELETRLGVRLLTRTTRSVVADASGRAPATHRGSAVRRDRCRARGRKRASREAGRHHSDHGHRICRRHNPLAETWRKLLRQYPDIKVEIFIDNALTDIVAQRFDAGVRAGEQVAKDMIAVRIGPDLRMAVVGAPSYFRKRADPKKPQDLIGHNCINLRLSTHGGLYAWEFEKGSRELKVRVEGQLVFNGTFQMLNAALAGFGLAYVPEDLAQPHLAKGRLKRVLEDWCPPYPGYHLYYPSRRQSSAAFALLVDALRYRG